MRTMENWCPGGSLEGERYVCNLRAKIKNHELYYPDCPYETKQEMREKCDLYRMHCAPNPRTKLGADTKI